MLKINISAYSGKVLQGCRDIIAGSTLLKMSNEDLLTAIKKEIEQRNKPDTRPSVLSMQPDMACPDCSSTLTIAKVEGLYIKSCRNCRWSAVIEGDKK